MSPYIVLYKLPTQNTFENPYAFECQADDMEHAEEQCLNAYPDAYIEWTHPGTDLEDAMADYQDCSPDFTPTIYVEVQGGCVTSIYGDDAIVRFVVRDLAAIEAGADDPLPENYISRTTYW